MRDVPTETTRQPRRPRSRLGYPAVLSCICLLISFTVACGQSPYELSVVPKFGQVYPPDRWVPLRVELRNNSNSVVDGCVVIPIAQPQAPVSIRMPIVVPSHSRVVATAYAYLPEHALATTATEAAPVAIAEWRGADGARIARAEVLGRPDTAARADAAQAAGLPGYLLLEVRDENASELSDAYHVDGLAQILVGQAPFNLSVGSCEPRSLPRHRAGYDAVRAIVFVGTLPAALDEFQRQAIIEYLLGGGSLVLPAPRDVADPSMNWLAPYLPVQVLGYRHADRIEPVPAEAGRALAFRFPVEICEAVIADGQSLLADTHYVHAAVRKVGLGRVIFTSFPVDALDHADPRTPSLWQSLLEPNEMPDWRNTALAQHREAVLGQMIGARAAPWSAAIAMAGGYVVLVMLIQLIIRGAHRPIAFALTTGIAIALCGGLIIATYMRLESERFLSAARLAIVELGPSGGGLIQEALMFLGGDDHAVSLQVDPAAVVRPLSSSSVDPPTIDELPFAVPSAGILSGRVDRVWHGSGVVSIETALTAGVEFTEKGVQLVVVNDTGHTVHTPLVLWGQRAFPLPDLSPGRTSLRLGPANPKSQFTNAGVLMGEQASLRARIIEYSQTARTDVGATLTAPSMSLVGWLDPSAGGIASPVIRSSTAVTLMQSQVMCRTALATLPSQVGSAVTIPPEFVVTSVDSSRGAPYDLARAEWVPSRQSGAWGISFQLPRGLGRIGSVQATIAAEIAAPAHEVVLRRGQCREGTLFDNPEGPILARWSRPTGTRALTAALERDDFDADQRLWLRLSIDPTREEAASEPQEWRLKDLSVQFEVDIEPDTQTSMTSGLSK